jgi:hypothetical protein
MASSSGSSRAFPRPGSETGRRVAWIALWLAPLLACAAPLPDYVRTALARFSPGAPATGWAYTVTTTRNDARMVERYDPARPPAARWQLLELDGQAPTPGQREQYARSRPHAESGGAQANFTREDIDPGSLQLVRETDHEAEWTAGFREASTGPDKMLGHLALRLTIDKRTPHIAAYAMELKEPYSPVIGVRMTRLVAVVRYHPPAPDRPALPELQTSRFTGRILFIPTEENLEVRFTDYAPVPTKLSR